MHRKYAENTTKAEQTANKYKQIHEVGHMKSSHLPKNTMNDNQFSIYILIQFKFTD